MELLEGKRCGQKVLHKTIIAVFLMFFLPLFFMAVSNNPFELQLSFNQLTHPSWDPYIRYLTHLGDGLIYIPVLLVLIFVDRFSAVHLVFTGLVSLTLVAVFKGMVFEEFHRPKMYFMYGFKEVPHLFREQLRLTMSIDDMKLHNSFPSGHTTSAIAMAFVLMMRSLKKSWIVFYMLLFVFIALTRVYLNQHFVRDVVFGMFLGGFSAYLSYGVMHLTLCRTRIFNKFVK